MLSFISTRYCPKFPVFCFLLYLPIIHEDLRGRERGPVQLEENTELKEVEPALHYVNKFLYLINARAGLTRYNKE